MRVPLLLCIFLVSVIIGLFVEGMDDRECQKDIDDMSKRSRTRRCIFVNLIKNSLDDTLNNVTFTLYTRKNPKIGQKLRDGDRTKLKKSYFDASKPTRFVTHGWRSDGRSLSCTLIRKAYLSRSDCNVIIVDWSKYTKSRGYLFARYMVKYRIGKVVARMINFLYKKGNLDPKSTTLIGHSLGAHVMGIAGYETKHKVNHIVGLDPALSGFLLSGPDKSISTESGKHVQIIHTNGGFFGRRAAIGHVDFFPNGGSDQPGCTSNECSHRRAYQLFASSITTPLKGTRCASYKKFKAGKCGARAKMARMGGLKLTGKSGRYYLRTNSEAPFRLRT